MAALASLALTLFKNVIVKYWKIILILLALGIVAYGVYRVYRHIENIGYQKGFTAGQADKQKVIDAMLTQQSAQNKANNDKIDSLVQASHEAASKEFALRAQLETARNKIVDRYAAQNPVSSTTCGFDVPMVKEINNLLLTDPSLITPGSNSTGVPK